MYLGDPGRRKKRRSSPVRVAILLILIGFGLYLYALIRREEIEGPYVPEPTPTRSAFSYAGEAEEQYLQGNFEEAITIYRQAVALDPEDVRLRVPLVRLLTLEERHREAIRDGRQAVEMAPENASAWAVLCRAYDWDGQVDAAIEACRRAIELDPALAIGYAYLAEAYADAMRWGEATEAAETALQLDPRDVDVLRNYGYVLEVRADRTGAIDAYRQALEIHPNLAHVYIAIGRNQLVQGDLDAAFESFKRAVEIDPDDPVANDLLGWTYYGLGEHEMAETYLIRATEADPQRGRAYGHLAINYWARRNYEAAIPNFERAIRHTLAAARQNVQAFFVTVETSATPGFPSADVVLWGGFRSTSEYNRATLVATLAAERLESGWSNAGGTVTLDTETGEYTIELEGIPGPASTGVYVGWFDELKTLTGGQLSTGPLTVRAGGRVQAELETGLVEACPLEYYYTLGLAYFYVDQCDKAYPLFNAALQIDPEEPNATEGIRLCNLSNE
jgi:tetratricopeptide (TPR) repeat protein